MEDFGNELRLVLRFRRFERRKLMSEEERETRTDEDVEGHVAKNAVGKGATKARNDEDDGDDVEAHVAKNAATKGMTKL
jgi:hypothetical protein